MALNGWVVSSIIRLNHSNFTAGMDSVARSTARASDAMLRQRGIISANEARMRAYARTCDEARAAQMRLGTTIAGWGFAIGAAGLIYATSEAAKFERAMTGVQIATSASAKQFKALGDMAFHVSGITAQSAVTIAREMQAAAEVAFKKPEQLMALFPAMAKYADVRYMASDGKEDPVHSIQQMASFAHYFAAYDVDKMRRMLDDTARLQSTTHASLDELVYQGKYFIPAAVKLGVSESEIMSYLAIMGQTGFLQGYGGSALNRLILGAEGGVSPNAHLSKARASGLRDLNMYDSVGRFRFVDEKGHLLLDKMIQHLQAMREQFERANPRTGNGRWMTDMGGAFELTGQRIGNIIADLVTRQQMNRNKIAFGSIPGVEGQWGKYGGDLFYQWNAFKTNLENIATALALPSLPDVTKGLKAINAQLLAWGDWLKQHPDAAKRIFEAGLAITAAFGVRFTAGVISAAANVWRLNAAITALSIASGGAATTGLIGAAGGVAAAAKGGPAGFFARVMKVGGGILGFLDNLLLAGLGGKTLGASRNISSVATSAFGRLFDAVVNGIKTTITSRFTNAVRFGSASFRAGVLADMQKSFSALGKDFSGLLDHLFGPLVRTISFMNHFVPGFTAAVDGFVAALGRIGFALGNIAKFIPGLDIAALVLSTQSQAGDADEEARARAWDARRARGAGASGGVHLHGDVNIRVDGSKSPHETGQAVIDALRSLTAGNPATARGRQGNNWTGPRIGNGATVSAF